MRHRFRSDTFISLLLVVVSAVAFFDTYSIRTMPFAGTDARMWPRIIICVMFALSVIYFFQSIVRKPVSKPPTEQFGLIGSCRMLVGKYSNALWSFVLFSAFILLIKPLGMLLAGALFVFSILTVTGPLSGRNLVQNLCVAVLVVGGVWALFTFLLGVILPTGKITQF